jgi:hypothetical protein
MDQNTQNSIDYESLKAGRRWYDKDPVLSKAIKTLEKSDDQIQIQIALNLIKIVIEHKIELEEFGSIEELLSTVKNAYDADEGRQERWYDLNETVRAAMVMLENCPEDLRQKIARDIAELISRMIQQG